MSSEPHKPQDDDIHLIIPKSNFKALSSSIAEGDEKGTDRHINVYFSRTKLLRHEPLWDTDFFCFGLDSMGKTEIFLIQLTCRYYSSQIVRNRTVDFVRLLRSHNWLQLDRKEQCAMSLWTFCCFILFFHLLQRTKGVDEHVTPAELQELLDLENRLLRLSCCDDGLDGARCELEEILQYENPINATVG